MKKIQFFGMLLLIMLNIVVWAANTPPVLMLQESARQIIAVLEQNKSNLAKNKHVIVAAVQKYLVPHVDVNGMSRSVLGRIAWNKATAAQREDFTKQFTQLVIRTYTTPLAEYHHETIRFLPIRDIGQQRFLHVDSVIENTNGRKIPLRYSLVLLNNEWKIYDFSIEGVSLLQSFRTQFATALSQSDMTALLSVMRQHSKGM